MAIGLLFFFFLEKNDMEVVVERYKQRNGLKPRCGIVEREAFLSSRKLAEVRVTKNRVPRKRHMPDRSKFAWYSGVLRREPGYSSVRNAGTSHCRLSSKARVRKHVCELAARTGVE